MLDLVDPALSSKRLVSSKSIDIGARYHLDLPADAESGAPLAVHSDEYYNMDDLILDDAIKDSLKYIMSENKSHQKLLSYGLVPRQKILLCGPPGTGKTLSSKVMASMMGYPFVYVEFDSIISSYLGQTASNLRKIFNFMEEEKCLVLFDEFDMVGKSRSDDQEHGEIKRVVSNFMQMLDTYSGECIIVAATNHQHLLDNAIWRRFDDVILYKLPDSDDRHKLFEKYLKVLRHETNFNLDSFVSDTDGFSAADIAVTCKDAMRRSLINNQRKVKKTDLIWAMHEQKRRKSVILTGHHARQGTGTSEPS